MAFLHETRKEKNPKEELFQSMKQKQLYLLNWAVVNDMPVLLHEEQGGQRGFKFPVRVNYDTVYDT